MKRVVTVIFSASILFGFVEVATATHDPNDFFALEASFPGITWIDVHGTSSTNVMAIGLTNTDPFSPASQVYSIRTGGTWSTPALIGVGAEPGTPQPFVVSTTLAFSAQAFTGVSVGHHQYNGATWATQTANPAFQTLDVSLWGVSSTNALLWAHGGPTGDPTPNGIDVFPWNGVAYGAGDSCPTIYISLSDAFALGTSYYAWASTSLTLERLRVDAPYTTCADDGSPGIGTDYSGAIINDLWGATSSEADLWSVGGSGLIFRDLTQAMSPTANNLNAIWGVTASNIWAVGDLGTIIHYSGTSWTLEPPLAQSEDLNGVYFSDANNGWAVSSTGNIFKLQVNPNVAHPSLTGLQWDPADLSVHADDACLGDEVSLSINLEPSLGGGGINWYVINSDSNVVVETGTAAQFFNTNNKHFHTSRAYPSGEYTFLVTADVVGLLTPDNWAGESFNVDTGSCFTAGDATRIDNRFNTLEQRLTFINQTTINTKETINLTQTEIAGSLESFFWLALMATAYILLRDSRGVETRWGAILLFLFASVWAIVAFEEAFAQGFAFALAFAAFLWAATVKPVTR